ncbi:T9SS type A sorting domain-containing protein [Xanthomarina sp. F2636L]|uniref:T9SS type A sorting domain-containing protein n=1 Tax=Xanthomarina sp. F2636L TaxID=2996018 RepID=UPI00225DFD36|nr:T9SS type A sorting domain-containing protein [Xanthomarina sp. F2636L]MCX7550225.1 T9SS type A sorting domain-containing protein [Xanthomarina sp. F2636L]
MKTTNKILLIFCFALLLQNSLFSQEMTECGTIETPESLEFYENNKQQIIEFEQEYLNNSNSRLTITSIPIKAHIIRTSSGTGGLSVSQLNDAMNVMNAFYVNANMEFYICDAINYIDDSTYYDFVDSDETALTGANNVSGLINIYFANTATSNGNNVCGYAYYPGGPDTIIMVNSCALNGSTLAHEMGHFFSLRHTHGGTPNELVDGSNCTTEGDYLCDTPADPTLSYSNVNASCVYIGTDTDANGDTYVPDPSNVMSYSRKECRVLFSPQQYARLYATFQTIRNNFACSSFNVDFVADQTQSCENSLAVNFTDNSNGATSWEWDVDGDDIIDYTTQNPSHTYNSTGIYDVTLTIYNATSSITKSNSEFIKIGAIENLPFARDFNTLTNLQADGWNATSTANSSFLWTLNAGTTFSPQTGPTGDNSPAGDGLYIYTEASGSNSGDVAEYTSPCIDINFYDATLTFTYHMYGSTMGELHIDIDSGSGFVNDISPAIIGQQQLNSADPYLERQIDLSAYAGQTIKFRFRAIRGANFNSDIAIDNININGTLSVNNLTDKTVRVYPNPVKDYILNVKLKNSSDHVSYRILNIIGQEIMNGNLENETINVSKLKAGTYFLTLASDKNTFTKKIIKL